MYKIAIVEDDNSASELLKSFIERYSTEKGVNFEVERFVDGLDFICKYSVPFNIVIMDIEMPNMNGLESAKKLRKIDDLANIIFATNMARYAIKGYEVDAIGFLVKPIGYSAFSLQLNKAIKRIEYEKHNDELIEFEGGVIKRLSLKSIYYIEVIGHFLYYHTTEGTFKTYGQISKQAETLTSNNFYRCQKSYLINLQYVTELKLNSVMVCNTEIPISRGSHNQLFAALTKFLRESR